MQDWLLEPQNSYSYSGTGVSAFSGGAWGKEHALLLFARSTRSSVSKKRFIMVCELWLWDKFPNTLIKRFQYLSWITSWHHARLNVCYNMLRDGDRRSRRNPPTCHAACRWRNIRKNKLSFINDPLMIFISEAKLSTCSSDASRQSSRRMKIFNNGFIHQILQSLC